MDVAAAGQASAQINAAQRTQQLTIAALRTSQLQAQSLASMLGESAASGTAAAGSSPPPATPAQGGTGGNTNQTRGSLVNILV